MTYLIPVQSSNIFTDIVIVYDHETKMNMPPTFMGNNRCVTEMQHLFYTKGIIQFCRCSETDCPVNTKMVQWIAAVYWFCIQYARTTGRQFDVATFIPAEQIRCFVDNHAIQTKSDVDNRLLNAYRPKVLNRIQIVGQTNSLIDIINK